MRNTVLGIFIIIITTTSCKDNDPEIDGFTVKTDVNPEDAGIIEYQKADLYPKGSILSLTAMANDDFYFKNWSGATSESDPLIEINLDGNKELTANFGPLSDILNDNIVQYLDRKIDRSGLVFMIENGQDECYLVDRKGKKIKSWEFDTRLGNDIQILPNGKLLGIFKDTDPKIQFGGGGGILKIIDQDGTISWEMKISDENEIAHHAVEQLPNGNIITIVWEKITQQEANDNGILVTHDVFPEKIIEINPANNQVVWQWRSWDHIIQDQDMTKETYGLASENPHKIDILYDPIPNGDWMHANGIFYDAKNDLIYLSVNYYSEVWVIDHSTNQTEAASDTGGNYNRGGDLVYRFGNPEVFGNTTSPRLFYNNHNPILIADDLEGAGNFLIYNNGSNNSQSVVYELQLPNYNETVLTSYKKPEEIWSYTNEDLFYDRISGAARLPNGNTLICEGDYGYWEVTKDKTVVWKYDGLGINYWRGYYYEFDSDNLKNLLE